MMGVRWGRGKSWGAPTHARMRRELVFVAAFFSAIVVSPALCRMRSRSGAAVRLVKLVHGHNLAATSGAESCGDDAERVGFGRRRAIRLHVFRTQCMKCVGRSKLSVDHRDQRNAENGLWAKVKGCDNRIDGALRW